MSYEALCDAGLSVPDDCSLLGIDVLPIHTAYHLITQFVCPGMEVGRAAAELLERRSTTPTDGPQHTLVKPLLRECTSVSKR